MSSGDILTKRDVAQLLQVSERTVERWMSEAAIPYVPLPRRGAWSEARFLRSEIVEWMRKRTVMAVDTFGLRRSICVLNSKVVFRGALESLAPSATQGSSEDGS